MISHSFDKESYMNNFLNHYQVAFTLLYSESLPNATVFIFHVNILNYFILKNHIRTNIRGNISGMPSVLLDEILANLCLITKISLLFYFYVEAFCL